MSLKTLVRSELLDSLNHISYGFGNREQPIPESLLPFWEKKGVFKQVHKTNSMQLEYPKQQCGEVDALWTMTPCLPVAVQTADCVPVLLAHRKKGLVAAVHAGWRGTIAGVTQAVWKKLPKADHEKEDWFAVIGPCVGSCCYQVSIEVMDQFKNKFLEFDLSARSSQERHLDLGYIQERILQRLGIQEIENLNWCTYCGRKGEKSKTLFPTKQEITRVFHSYRRMTHEKEETAQSKPCRQFSGIFILGDS